MIAKQQKLNTNNIYSNIKKSRFLKIELKNVKNLNIKLKENYYFIIMI